MALTDLQALRLNVADNEPGLYILSDDEMQYFLDTNGGSIPRASIAAAKVILLKLSQRNDETVDVFSVKSSKSAENYRLALELFLKDPNLNPLIGNLQGYFGGVSISDMETNNGNCDNNIVENPGKTDKLYQTGPFTLGWRF